jgi:hypothetical protein
MTTTGKMASFSESHREKPTYVIGDEKRERFEQLRIE